MSALEEKRPRENRILTEPEFAALVKHHPVTIGNMRRRGEIDYCKAGRKVWYINPDHVESFHRRFERKARV